MKIALVSPYDFSYPGGVTEHTAALAEGLQRSGHTVQVIAASSGYQPQKPPYLRPVTHHVITIPIAGATARVGLSPLSYLRIRQILHRETFDIIHLQEPLTPSITWPVLLQNRILAQIPTVGTFHAYHERANRLYAWGRPIFGRVFAQLDGLIAVSEAARDFARRMFPGDYKLIPNGVDWSRFGRQPKPVSPYANGSDDWVTILFVGRLDWRKGFVNLLQAFLALKPIYPKLRLVVVGPFDERASQPYRRLTAQQAATDVEFVGYVSPERLPAFYHQADLFCAPSVGFESFGLVLLEAMAAGLPVIASDIAGYRSLVTDGREGFLAPPAQPRALMQALARLITTPHRRCEMGWQGYLKAKDYRWDRIIEGVVGVYRETIGRKQPNASTHLKVYNSAAGLCDQSLTPND